MKKSQIDEIFKILKKHYEDRSKIELNHVNNFTMLVAIVLSAQATDIGVNKATKELFKVVDTPEKMVELGLEKLKSYVKTLNYFNNKSKYIIALSKSLIEKFDSKIPNNFDELVKLSGVGKKSAKVFLNQAFGAPFIGVDTHVFRTVNRIGLVNEKDIKKTDEKLDKVILEKYKKHIGHWLVIHGRYVCKARKPLCKKCPLTELCEFYKKNV